MSAAGAREEREELETRLWRYGLDAAQVTAALSDADRYAKAAVKASREPKPPAPKKPPAVHFTLPSGRLACLPFDWAAGRGRLATADPASVTCGHCRKTPAWADATVATALEERMARRAS